MVASSYEIEILSFSFQSVTDEGQRKEMDALRALCADLIEGVDQEKPSIYRDDPMDHHGIMVSPSDVGEAVRRINEAGYATDEDESDDEEEEEIVLTDDMFDEE